MIGLPPESKFFALSGSANTSSNGRLNAPGM
jgi:hypothetical protein